ncbi:MAG: MFS transporter [Paracoccus sp. (in: a-proteobacteria)]
MSDASTDAGSQGRAMWHDAGWRAVVAAFMLNGLLFGVWASRVPAFKDHFALEAGTLGLLLFALAGGAIASFPLAGALVERWGADRMTVCCACLSCPPLIGIALAPDILSLGMLLFVFGALQGAMDVAMNGWGAQVENRLGRATMSIYHAMFSLGAGLGAASGFIAIRLGLVPLVHFTIMAVIGGAIALYFMLAVRSLRKMAVAGKGGHEGVFRLPSGALFFAGIIGFAISVGEGAMTDWSAVYLRSAIHVSEAQAALGYAAFSVAMVLTRLCGTVFVQRLGSISTMRLSGLTAFVGLVVVVLADRLALALLGFALIGVGYAVVMPLVFSRAANDPVIRPGPAIASVATLTYGGLLLGPPLVGFVAQLTDLRVSFAILALLALFAALMAPTLRISR